MSDLRIYFYFLIANRRGSTFLSPCHITLDLPNRSVHLAEPHRGWHRIWGSPGHPLLPVSVPGAVGGARL